MIGRCGRFVSAKSPVVVGVIGLPLRACQMIPVCQSLVTVFRKPPPTPGLTSTADRLKLCLRSATHGPLLVDVSGGGCLLVRSAIGSGVQLATSSGRGGST